ncbi:M20 family metallo-hydrolase [Pelagibius litoralis]|uniref:M20 family metallo-hydrolase n=2 Tax=Pelagibius litoralis TaxID=374515 RepID=A0A967KFJ0_9PROT|nr:M20 family metallo-hydrolase [Pelagibius litoralis]
MQRLDEVAQFSEGGPGVTRRPFTDEHRRANQLITTWMQQAGLDVHIDAAGTLVGRKAGPPGSKTLLIGSHQDTISHGGKYDGMFGIALPILVLESLREQTLPYSVEILAFADEEGVRFPTALMGPRVLAGTFDDANLQKTDKDGVSLAAALSEHGGDPDSIAAAKRNPGDLIGYLEVHIEQGPLLESLGLPVGIVTAICGIERWTVELTGQAAHAGTTPMDLRRDAFAGAAEIALAVEGYCQAMDGLVGIVASMTLSPNVPNAIPGKAAFTIELRASDDLIREAAASALTQWAEAVSKRRALGCRLTKTYAQKAVPCDPWLRGTLVRSLTHHDFRPHRIMSGATHDASAMADLCPVAMLFTRCRDGLSHHPDEAITAADAQASAACLAAFLQMLDSD